VIAAATTVLALLVPAYFNPGPLWARALAAGPRAELIANPDNGPGPTPQSGYRQIARTAAADHERMFGYVDTGNGSRSVTAIERDVLHYGQWYGIHDIFFDVVSGTPGDLAMYWTISNYARQHGATEVVLNPGDVPAQDYMRLGDVVVTFEDTYAHYLHATFPGWLHRYPASEQANIVIEAPTSADAQHAVALAAARGAGLMFVTNGRLPNPYEILPSFFGAELTWVG
jgi:spherulation-specific family 4 protein